MATVTKEWTNGDLLTLVTSAGGIAVSSAENLTGADREMTIRVQTTNQGAKAFQDIPIKQLANISEYYRNLISYAQGNSIALPVELAALRTLITDLDDAGILDKLDLFYLFAGSGIIAFKLINIVNPGTYNGTGYGGLVSSNNGVTGNGSNARIDTGFNPGIISDNNRKYQLNDASRGAYLHTYGTGLHTFDGIAGVQENMFQGGTTSGGLRKINQKANNSQTGTLFQTPGIVALSRNSASSFLEIHNHISSVNNTSSAGISSFSTQSIFRAATANWGTDTLSCYFMGASITLAESEIMDAAIKTFLNSLV